MGKIIRTTGPFRGPMDQIENARARYSSVTMSEILPGALAIMALPARAPKKRTTRTSVKDVAKPQGMTSTMKKNIAIM